MKFALLGIDAETLPLVRAIAESNLHRLVWICPASAPLPHSDLVDEVRLLAPLAQESADWEVLLGGAAAEAVIVAGGTKQPGRFEQLRRLVQEQVPVVVSHPITLSVLEAYELEMVRGEAGGVMVPLLTARWYMPMRQLVGIVQSARARATDRQPIGRVEQISWDRQLVDRSRGAVLGQFARDVDFVRAMCGEITQVAALGPGVEGTDLSRLGVQMTGPAGILVRWSVQVPESPLPEKNSGGRITLIGSAGRVILEMPDAESPRQWKLQPADRHEVSQPPNTVDDSHSANLADMVAERVEQARTRCAASDEATWSDAIRSLELVEALEKSLKKGRTVTLNFEGRGEADAFKGTMASVGCGLLIGGLVLVVIAAILDKIAQKTGNKAFISFVRCWPVLLALLLGLFLLLQLLRLVIPGREPSVDKAGKMPDRRDG